MVLTPHARCRYMPKIITNVLIPTFVDVIIVNCSSNLHPSNVMN